MTTPRAPAARPETLVQPDGVTIAYRALPGKRPGVMFLPGFMSDMGGAKASALDASCRAHGRAYVRFDYQGHGLSSGEFAAGTVGRWTEDAIAVLDEVARGRQVLVGSSMGGWIMLLVALARPERVAGLVAVAPAADFTEELIWRNHPEEMRQALDRNGRYLAPSQYGDEPYVITSKLIEEGRGHLLLGGTIPLACPVRILHGIEDPDVPWQHSFKVAEALASRDVTITLVKGGDHRLSDPENLARLCETVETLCREVE